MLNYNEYTSCLDTRLYKFGREIGVTSHRRRDSQCGDDKIPLFLLIPNSAPQTSYISLFHPPSCHLHPHHLVSFFSTENRTFRRFILLHRKLNDLKYMLAILFGSRENLCVIDSRQCCSSRMRNRFDRSVDLCSRDLICTIWRRPKILLALPIRVIPTVLDR